MLKCVDCAHQKARMKPYHEIKLSKLNYAYDLWELVESDIKYQTISRTINIYICKAHTFM